MIPEPRALRSLLTRYADLRIAEARGEKRDGRLLDDVSYTLCVATGTTRIEDALAAADVLLAASRARSARPAPSRTARTAPELAA
ncbi:methionine ABC transporter ATP-binding protein [Streptomyces sp. NRRL F-6491]|nr:methionine ABC transporter ATP-binding protein [Streptomyces sp. NRRL F-6491]KOX51483.1 methionine ABC transporter ATP-binding protein [Streptomyces sp. NRRL F-6492]